MDVYEKKARELLGAAWGMLPSDVSAKPNIAAVIAALRECNWQPPVTVDPDVEFCRELLAKSSERFGNQSAATCYRNGEWDDEPEFTDVLAAYRAGKAAK